MLIYMYSTCTTRQGSANKYYHIIIAHIIPIVINFHPDLSDSYRLGFGLSGGVQRTTGVHWLVPDLLVKLRTSFMDEKIVLI